MRNDFYFPSSDGRTNIHAVEWTPSSRPRAVLQIIHGMVEYAARYDRFASFMTDNGFAVVANDHLGHGKSVISDEYHGYFAEDGGLECLISDIHTLRTRSSAEYPDVPYFILGHSMGSFLVRMYMMQHGDGIAGFIMMGTGAQPQIALTTGMTLCRAMALVYGWKHRSGTVDSLAFASYNKKFRPARTRCDWLTRDTAVLDEYIADPWCSFVFTLNGYLNLFRVIDYIQKPRNIAATPHVPMLIISGGDDPVGHFGRDPGKVAEMYKSLGYGELTVKLYPGGRHEILNELNYGEVFDDILSWLSGLLG